MRWTRPTLTAIGLTATLWLAGCTGPARANAITSGAPTAASQSPSETLSPTVAPAPSSAKPAPSRSPSEHAGTPTRTHPPATSHPKPNAAPHVGSVTISPLDFGACDNPSVRPTVTAKVTDADDAPASLRVTASYYLSSTYQGNVRMHYDAGRGLFVVQLPAVTAKAAKDFPGISGGHLGASVAVTDPAGNAPRPSAITVVTVEGCG